MHSRVITVILYMNHTPRWWIGEKNDIPDFLLEQDDCLLRCHQVTGVTRMNPFMLDRSHGSEGDIPKMTKIQMVLRF